MKVTEEKVWWEFTCKTCGSKCEAEPNDVTSRPTTDCDGDVVDYICVVECGKCGKQHDVPSRKVTAKIEKIAADKRH
jgi:hypothetical protein